MPSCPVLDGLRDYLANNDQTVRRVRDATKQQGNNGDYELFYWKSFGPVAHKPVFKGAIH